MQSKGQISAKGRHSALNMPGVRCLWNIRVGMYCTGPEGPSQLGILNCDINVIQSGTRCEKQ